MRGKSGFKASLAENVSFSLPYEVAVSAYLSGSGDEIVLDTAVLKNLVDVSKAFPPKSGSHQYVELQANQTMQAVVQPSEIGTLDNYPLEGTHTGVVQFRLPTEGLQRILTFGGESTKIGTCLSMPGYVILSDPDNSSWWSLMGQLIIEGKGI